MKLSFNNDNCSVDNFGFLKSFSNLDGKISKYPTGTSRIEYSELFSGSSHIKLNIDSQTVFLGEFAPKLDLSTADIYYDVFVSPGTLYVLFDNFFVKYN